MPADVQRRRAGNSNETEIYRSVQGYRFWAKCIPAEYGVGLSPPDSRLDFKGVRRDLPVLPKSYCSTQTAAVIKFELWSTRALGRILLAVCPNLSAIAVSMKNTETVCFVGEIGLE